MQQIERISPGQAWVLLFLYQVGSGFLFPKATDALQDAWLAVLAGTAATLVMVPLYTRLAARYPEETLIQFAPRVLGYWPGKLVGLLYILYSLHLAAWVLRDSVDFLIEYSLPLTPPLVIASVISLVVWAAVRLGLEVLGRALTLMLPFVLVVPVLAYLPAAHPAKWTNLLPMLEKGWIPFWKGSLDFFVFPVAEVVVFLAIVPQVFPKQQVGRVFRVAVICAGLFYAALTLRDQLIMGPLFGRHYYPLFALLATVRVGGFIEGVEAAAVISWIISTFSYIAVHQYIATLGFAQWLGLRDYRPLTGPLVLSSVLIGFWFFPSVNHSIDFAHTTYRAYAPIFQVLLPVLLLLVATVRKPARPPA